MSVEQGASPEPSGTPEGFETAEIITDNLHFLRARARQANVLANDKMIFTKVADGLRDGVEILVVPLGHDQGMESKYIVRMGEDINNVGIGTVMGLFDGLFPHSYPHTTSKDITNTKTTHRLSDALLENRAVSLQLLPPTPQT